MAISSVTIVVACLISSVEIVPFLDDKGEAILPDPDSEGEFANYLSMYNGQIASTQVHPGLCGKPLLIISGLLPTDVFSLAPHLLSNVISSHAPKTLSISLTRPLRLTCNVLHTCCFLVSSTSISCTVLCHT